MRIFSIILLSFALVGCESTYYSVLEKVGVQKKDILNGKVEAASQAYIDAKEEFNIALTSLQELTQFNGEDLEKTFKKIEKQYKNSESATETVTESINEIEAFSATLFNEWDNELDLYSNSGLRRESERKFKETKLSYQQMHSAMAKAEKKMQPVIEALRDNMLYLKHNLNPESLEALSVEFGDLKIDVERAIRDINSAIEESQLFLDNLNQRESTRSARR